MELKSHFVGLMVLYALTGSTECSKCSYSIILPDRDECGSEDTTTSDIQSQITNLAEQITVLMNENVLWRELALNKTAQSGCGASGAVYTRWGRTTCPSRAATIYSGYAAGSGYRQVGGLSELLCLPKDPEWGSYRDGLQARSLIFGAEYEVVENYEGLGVFEGDNTEATELNDQEIPCSVCYTPGRAVVHKFPAKLTCPEGWQEEYRGYLMAGRDTYNTKVQGVCMDEAPETIEVSVTDVDGAHVYNVEGVCGVLPCPPYVEGRELTCVICSR